MSEQLSYFARDLIEQGEDFVVARVVETSGSTPRKKGAVLMMKKDGTTVGTVGGGLLEAETEKLCRQTFETKEKWHIYDCSRADYDHSRKLLLPIYAGSADGLFFRLYHLFSWATFSRMACDQE